MASQEQSSRRPGLLRRIGSWFRRLWSAVAPGRRAWRGAALGLLLAAAVTWGIFVYNGFLAPPRLLSALIGFVAGAAACALFGGLVLLLVSLFKSLPVFYRWVLVAAWPLLIMPFLALSVALGMVAVALGAVVFCSLWGAGLWVLARGGWPRLTTVQRVITVAGLVLGLTGTAGGVYWLWFYDGAPANPPPNAAALSAAPVTPLALPDPSQPGPYVVQSLTYGSGQDRHRPEYAAQATLLTGPVDGSPFLEGWSGWRTDYWGFGPDSLPRNGRVWYPAGEGPFPLVLMVHGNHFMEDFSDPGYAYLGELLASRGFIAVSVDENFFNLMVPEEVTGGGLKEETDARGWLLLEHLQLWRAWNETAGNPFYRKVDLQNVALVGHSRGGEAVVVAAVFNRLSRYPDDAMVVFDYNFGIRSVVAIAPVAWQYLPAGREPVLENVSYFVLQGTHDMDVYSFLGAKQYEKVHFTDGRYGFKAGLYIYGANHGQFNTTWGRTDGGEPANRLYNLRQLLPAADQERIARVTISAFMEATLHDARGYVALFRDPRAAAAWLPATIYLSQCEESTARMVSTYEEDLDVETTTLPGGRQLGENLTIWREQQVPLKMGSLETGAAYLGWDSTAGSGVPGYTITLPPEGVPLDAESVLVFSLADANLDPNPKDKKPAPAGPREPIDLTVEVVDRAGASARLPLSAFSLLQPQVEAQLGKAAFIQVAAPSEVVFQTLEFPLASFVAANPNLDPADLATVRLVFDRTPAGVVVLDDVGFRR
jgi:dienelactone hydrolase